MSSEYFKKDPKPNRSAVQRVRLNPGSKAHSRLRKKFSETIDEEIPKPTPVEIRRKDSEENSKKNDSEALGKSKIIDSMGEGQNPLAEIIYTDPPLYTSEAEFSDLVPVVEREGLKIPDASQADIKNFDKIPTFQNLECMRTGSSPENKANNTSIQRIVNLSIEDNGLSAERDPTKFQSFSFSMGNPKSKSPSRFDVDKLINLNKVATGGLMSEENFEVFQKIKNGELSPAHFQILTGENEKVLTENALPLKETGASAERNSAAEKQGFAQVAAKDVNNSSESAKYDAVEENPKGGASKKVKADADVDAEEEEENNESQKGGALGQERLLREVKSEERAGERNSNSRAADPDFKASATSEALAPSELMRSPNSDLNNQVQEVQGPEASLTKEKDAPQGNDFRGNDPVREEGMSTGGHQGTLENPENARENEAENLKTNNAFREISNKKDEALQNEKEVFGANAKGYEAVRESERKDEENAGEKEMNSEDTRKNEEFIGNAGANACVERKNTRENDATPKNPGSKGEDLQSAKKNEGAEANFGENLGIKTYAQEKEAAASTQEKEVAANAQEKEAAASAQEKEGAGDSGPKNEEAKEFGFVSNLNTVDALRKSFEDRYARSGTENEDVARIENSSLEEKSLPKKDSSNNLKVDAGFNAQFLKRKNTREKSVKFADSSDSKDDQSNAKSLPEPKKNVNRQLTKTGTLNLALNTEWASSIKFDSPLSKTPPLLSPNNELGLEAGQTNFGNGEKELVLSLRNAMSPEELTSPAFDPTPVNHNYRSDEGRLETFFSSEFSIDNSIHKGNIIMSRKNTITLAKDDRQNTIMSLANLDSISPLSSANDNKKEAELAIENVWENIVSESAGGAKNEQKAHVETMPDIEEPAEGNINIKSNTEGNINIKSNTEGNINIKSNTEGNINIKSNTELSDTRKTHVSKKNSLLLPQENERKEQGRNPIQESVGVIRVSTVQDFKRSDDEGHGLSKPRKSSDFGQEEQNKSQLKLPLLIKIDDRPLDSQMSSLKDTNLRRNSAVESSFGKEINQNSQDDRISGRKSILLNPKEFTSNLLLEVPKMSINTEIDAGISITKANIDGLNDGVTESGSSLSRKSSHGDMDELDSVSSSAKGSDGIKNLYVRTNSIAAGKRGVSNLILKRYDSVDYKKGEEKRHSLKKVNSFESEHSDTSNGHNKRSVLKKSSFSLQRQELREGQPPLNVDIQPASSNGNESADNKSPLVKVNFKLGGSNDMNKSMLKKKFLKRFQSMKVEEKGSDSDEFDPALPYSKSENLSDVQKLLKKMTLLQKYEFACRNKRSQKMFDNISAKKGSRFRKLPIDQPLLRKMMDKFFEKENFEENEQEPININPDFSAGGESVPRNSVRRRFSKNQMLTNSKNWAGLGGDSSNRPAPRSDSVIKLNEVPFENKSAIAVLSSQKAKSSNIFFKNNEMFVINIKKEDVPKRKSSKNKVNINSSENSSSSSKERLSEDKEEDDMVPVPKSAGMEKKKSLIMTIKNNSRCSPEAAKSKGTAQGLSFTEALNFDKMNRNIKRESKISKIDNILKFRRNSVKKEMKMSLQHYLKSKISNSSHNQEYAMEMLFMNAKFFEDNLGVACAKDKTPPVLSVAFLPIFNEVPVLKIIMDWILDGTENKRLSMLGDSNIYSESLKNISGEENNSE